MSSTERSEAVRMPRRMSRAAAVLTGVAMVAALAGCSARSASSPGPNRAAAAATPAVGAAAAPTAAPTAAEVTLTAAQRAQIHLYTVASSPFRKTIQTAGVVDYDNDHSTSVLAPFGGPVSRLLVSVGEQVKAGAPLATVDSPDFAAAISTYRKALATAQTARKLADLEQDLVRHRGIAPREQAQAQTDAANAEADRDAALQTLMSLHVDPQTIKAIQQGRPSGRVEAVIRAPIPGTVVERLITPGELLQAGTTACFTVADLSHVWVLAQVFGADIASVERGDPVDVQTDITPMPMSGTVTNIAAMVDPATRSVVARVLVDNPHDLLRKQMYVRVLIHARQESAGLMVPVSAILRDDDNLPFVYLSQSAGRFARRHVTVGYRDGDQYDISAGLQAGDQVVVEGGIFLQFIQNQ